MQNQIDIIVDTLINQQKLINIIFEELKKMASKVNKLEYEQQQLKENKE